MLNLDTHMVVALLIDDLSKTERRALDNDRWAISGIVLWELAKLVQLGRLEMDLGDRRFLAFLEFATVVPISLEIAVRSTQLDFRSDPADEIIAATSVVEKLPLLTRDTRIRASKMVPLALA